MSTFVIIVDINSDHIVKFIELALKNYVLHMAWNPSFKHDFSAFPSSLIDLHCISQSFHI